jgi:L-cystine uptake protein TcyP (sodium:dicarboxylate symporter family)
VKSYKILAASAPSHIEVFKLHIINAAEAFKLAKSTAAALVGVISADDFDILEEGLMLLDDQIAEREAMLEDYEESKSEPKATTTV